MTRALASILALLALPACGDDEGPECTYDNDCPLYERCSEGECVPLGQTRRDASLDAGDAGDGGDAGDAADTAVDTGPVLSFCAESCDSDDDCTIGDAGTADAAMDAMEPMDAAPPPFRCTSNRCTATAAPVTCDNDIVCRAQFSGWNVACTPPAVGCADGQACVNVRGNGRCATPPTLEAPCTNYGLSERVEMNVEGAQVTVCGVEATCRSGACVRPCTRFEDCTGNPRGAVCNTDTGECGCALDDDCVALGVSVCRAGVCACGANSDCASVPNADVCVEGRCGCSAATACTSRTFNGTTLTCEAP